MLDYYGSIIKSERKSIMNLYEDFEIDVMNALI